MWRYSYINVENEQYSKNEIIIKDLTITGLAKEVYECKRCDKKNPVCTRLCITNSYYDFITVKYFRTKYFIRVVVYLVLKVPIL